ncbi:MAG: O-antigen ligase family protein, partial [Bacteroidota bacterium]
VYGNLQLWGYYPSHHGLFKMTGSFFNPGPYAGYLAAVFPIALGFYFFDNSVRVPTQHPIFVKLTSYCIHIKASFKKVPFITHFFDNNSIGEPTPGAQLQVPEHTNCFFLKYLALISIICMFLVLPASRSRAAWLAVAVSSIYLIAIRYRLYSRAKDYFDTRIKQIFLLASFIVLLTITGAGLYQMKKGSADGRVLIWKVSMNIIKERPVFGYGFDQFKAHYMDYQADYFEQNPNSEDVLVAGDNNYAFNEPIQLMVENGLIGILLLVAIIWLVFPVQYKTRLSKETKEERTTNNNTGLSLQADQIPVEETGQNWDLLPFSRAVILSVLVFGLFSYPFQILPIKICLVVALATASGLMGRKVKTYRQQTFVPQTVRFALKSFILIGSIGLFWLATERIQHIQTAYSDWKNAFDIYNIGIYNDCLDDYKKAYPVLKTNGDFLTNYGKALSMAEKYPEAVGVLQQAAKYYPNTVVYTALGDSYKKLRQTAQAEQAYLHAWHMNPSRFYSKYLLAKLYDETGQHEKAVATAKELLGKEVKIESTAVKEIQEEMRKIIEKQENSQNIFNPKGKGRKHNQRVATASCPAPFLKKKVR